MNKINADDITELRQIKWKTNLSRNLEDFSNVISDDTVFEKYFGVEYVEKLTHKSKELSGTIIKLGLVYTILMLSLFASQNVNNSEFEVFGYGFKNLNNYKEFLLFLATVISPISAIFIAYQKYLNSLAKECLKKLSPDTNIRKFYSYRFIDEYFDGLLNAKPRESNSWHAFSVFIIISFGLVLLFLFFTLVISSFLIQIYVIYDVVTKPTLSYYMNLFVVTFAITSIAFSWLTSIIQLPMPEIDYSNYSKLSEIEEQDPEKYKEIMKKLAIESSKKEARSLIILYAIIYIVSFSVIAIQWYPSSLNNLYYFIGKAMPGAFFVMLLANTLLGYMHKKGLIWFFRSYPDESMDRLSIYGRMKNIFLLIKIAITVCMSVGYAFYSLSSN
jgi:hypothetical protein